MAERYIRVEDAHMLGSPYYGEDAPILELVRCGDCKYLNTRDYCCELHEFIYKQDDDYCSWGEEVDEVRNG